MMQIERPSALVHRVAQQGADAQVLRQPPGSQDSVSEQSRAQPAPPVIPMNREATQDCDRDGLRHVAAHPAGRHGAHD